MALTVQPANFLVNGDMSVAQKGIRFEEIEWFSSPYRIYSTDMWQTCQAVHDAKVVDEQVADHPILGANGFSKKITVDTAKPKLDQDDTFFVCQLIEPADCLQFLSGTVAAYLPFVVSGWLKSNVPGTYCVNYTNTGGQSFLFPVTLAQADVWTYFQQAITSNGYVQQSTKTGVLRIFAVGTPGAQVPPAANAARWSGNAGSRGVTLLNTQANLFSAAGNYLQVTDMKLEAGDFATPYLREPFFDRLGRCQRYYWQTFGYGVTPQQNTPARQNALSYTAFAAGATPNFFSVTYPCPMAAPPTITGYKLGPGAAGRWNNAGRGGAGPDTDSGEFRAPPPTGNGTTACRIANLQAAGDAAGDLMQIHVTWDATWWL